MGFKYLNHFRVAAQVTLDCVEKKRNKVPMCSALQSPEGQWWLGWNIEPGHLNLTTVK